MVDLVDLVIGLCGQATKASAAQSRVKMLAKMEANAAPLPEGKSTFKAKIKLPTPPACHTKQARIQCNTFIHRYLARMLIAILPGCYCSARGGGGVGDGTGRRGGGGRALVVIVVALLV